MTEVAVDERLLASCILAVGAFLCSRSSSKLDARSFTSLPIPGTQNELCHGCREELVRTERASFGNANNSRMVSRRKSNTVNPQAENQPDHPKFRSSAL